MDDKMQTSYLQAVISTQKKFFVSKLITCNQIQDQSIRNLSAVISINGNFDGLVNIFAKPYFFFNFKYNEFE